MSKTNQSTMRVTAPGAALDVDASNTEEMTERTAAELRELCREKGQEFDTALTEAQARRRIEALRDMD